ncbi:Outer membrane protein TolC [Spirosomataceae bacterium TFI 002]|nr:Outer membrane protein TolC [Spirosomataceae bacterium TFI 002]
MRIKATLILCLAFGLKAFSQQTFTVKEAVEYALKNHADVKNAQVGKLDAEKQITEIKQTGLPQINGSFQFTANLIVPTSILPANTFDPTAPEGAIAKVKFGVPWGGQAGIGLNQLVYDATWLVGLRAADTYRLLADQTLTQSKVTVSENVQKAYYSVLVAQERSGLVDLNIQRLDSVIYTTTELYKQGFVEKIDIDRLEVQRNNLITEAQKVKNLIDVSYSLLKFQMQYKQNQPIFLTDKLNSVDIEAMLAIEKEEINPEDRIEFNLIGTQRRLTELNIERYQKSYLPNVYFTGSLGASHGNPVFNPFERWFPSSAVSIGMNIPIFDSGAKRTKIEREQLNLMKIDNGVEMLKESFELQNNMAIINMKNGLESLEIQKRNFALAEEVVRVTQIKYKEGVGSNLEIVNAENDLKQAQTNYLAALYDVLVAKVDLDKAQGKLIID